MFQIMPILSAMMRNKGSVSLIIIQIALTLAIVSNATFIISERIAMMQRDTGLPVEEIFSVNSFFFDDRVDPIDQISLDARRLREMPGVISATSINQVPLSGSGDSWGVRDKREIEGAKVAYTGVYTGDHHTLSTLGQTVSQGRDFNADDVLHLRNEVQMPKAAIVTSALAKELFADENAIGKYIYTGPTDTAEPIEIIGVVAQMQGSWVHSDIVEKNVFFPVVNSWNSMTLVVRAEQSALDSIALEMEDVLLGLEKNRVVGEPRTMAKMKKRSYQRDRLMTNMLLVIVAVLIFITALGIAGVSIFNVNRRRKQIGTRRALGASKGDIVSYFMTESALIAAVGIVIGTLLTFTLNTFLMKQFSTTSLSLDYLLFTMVGIVLISQISAFWPAKKATHISPAIATRSA
ncbi:ABC transporter permease [Thalassotalea atypica]|uniref:ABC transporter permease n=1 Tax=Thalassotalea atypica TaxID=2054316 RepID=UPI0025723F1E|nr:FtsX-like permease family protein [Thalassotalea atypica]